LEFPDGRTIENGTKKQEITPEGLPQAPLRMCHATETTFLAALHQVYAPGTGKSCFLLVFQAGSAEKAQFSSLNP